MTEMEGNLKKLAKFSGFSLVFGIKAQKLIIVCRSTFEEWRDIFLVF